MRQHILAVSFLTASLVFASAALAAAGSEAAKGPLEVAEAEQPVAKLNPTGRTYEIEVPVKLDGARLGDVAIKITADEKLFVDAKLLKTYLGKVVLPEVLSAALAFPAEGATQVTGGTTVAGKKADDAANSSVMQFASLQEKQPEPGQLGQEPASYLPLDLIKQRGIAIRYDPLELELRVEPTVDQRQTSTISFESKQEIASEAMERPAYVSAYLNMRLAASYVSQSTVGNTGVEAPSLSFDGAIRIGSVVLEGEGTFSSGDTQGFTQSYFQNYVFYRSGTRFVYDMPDEAIRIRAGDITPSFAGLQTAPDLLGVSVEKSYAELQPQKTVRPTGSHSFRIERPSTVDIIVDNALVRRIKLAPGNYNISDLPLNPGANNVKLVIEDDTGARQTLEFTAFSGFELLSPGISEWSAGAGIKSADQGLVNPASSQGIFGTTNSTIVNKSARNSIYGQRDYYFNQPVASAFYKTGIATALTANADVQADDQAAMAGAGFVTQTLYGLFTAELAGSETYASGLGYAIHAGYGYDKFDWFGTYRAIFRVLGEYRSPGFATVGTIGTGVPIQDYNISVAATYTQQLPSDVTAGLSFSYYFWDHPVNSNLPDRWDANFTLSRQLWDNVSGSLSVGYGWDPTANTTACCASSQTNTPAISNQSGFQAFVRLAWAPDAHSNAIASYDSRSQTAEAIYSQTSETTGVGSWAATVDAATGANSQSAVNASASYVANRAEVSVNHSAGFSGIGYNGTFNPLSTEERTSVQVASSLVYADGAWGVGRPVTGGFALVTPHKSLDGSPVVVGATDSVVAESGWFGPAVVPKVPAFTQTRVPYDVPEAPAGYDLGSAAYDMNAPYRAGYNLQAGSAYTVSAMGTLLDTEGQPLSLLAGTAREANRENGRKVELFTNQTGRFGAQGLAPGKWIIEMPTEGEPARYIIEIPEGVVGLHNAGTLKPDGSAGQRKPPVIEAKADTDNGTN